MENKIKKVNMTKFDYTARKLGIVGICILTLTFAFGGTILFNLVKENQTLVNALADTHKEDAKVNNDIYVIENI